MDKSVLVFCSLFAFQNVLSQSNDECYTVDRRVGVCININNCKPLKAMMLNPKINSSDVTYLRNLKCGYEGYVPKVCCLNPNTTTTTTSTTTQSPTNYEAGVSSRLLSECGSSNVSSNRIVGGRNSDLGAWPWMTAIGSKNKNNQVEWICGGALVSDTFVVTAAHCTARVLSVARFGELDLDSSVNDEASPIDITISRVIIHHQYNTQTTYNDIALLKLEKKVTFGENIQPICLPTTSGIKNENLVNKSPVVSGWGATSFRGSSSTRLKEAPMPVIDDDQCKKIFANKRNVVIDNRVICAGDLNGKADSCQGDSGGPLMWPYQSKYYLVGVVSFGVKCAEPGYPGVYTRVTSFVDWIEQTMNKN